MVRLARAPSERTMARLASLIGLNHAASHPLTDHPRYTAAEIPPNVLVHLTELASRGIDCHDWLAGPGSTSAQRPDTTYLLPAGGKHGDAACAAGTRRVGSRAKRASQRNDGGDCDVHEISWLSTISGLYSDGGNRRNATDAKARIFRSLGGDPLRA